MESKDAHPPSCSGSRTACFARSRRSPTTARGEIIVVVEFESCHVGNVSDPESVLNFTESDAQTDVAVIEIVMSATSIACTTSSIVTNVTGPLQSGEVR